MSSKIISLIIVVLFFKSLNPIAGFAQCNTTRAEDSLSLVQFYNSTNGNAWTNKWTLTDNMSTWRGVSLSGGRVVGITLPNNNLTGKIDSSLFKICALETLNLSAFVTNSNRISDTLPPQIAQLTALKNVNLYGNKFSGFMPTLKSDSLTDLNLGQNEFRGNFPNLDNCPNLKNANLSFNGLTGALSAAFFSNHAATLDAFNCSYNKFTGAIPIEIGNCTQLKSINLFDNLITGSIPSSINNLTNLLFLELGNMQLTGNIPDLSNLTKLELLSLYRNRLSGSIPASIINLHDLKKVYLNNNTLTGSIPVGMNNLQVLELLDLSNNQLTGAIPDFDNCRGLAHLSLNNNQLTGAIPNFNLGNLEYLNLSFNQLTGAVPNLSLPKLKYLSNYNNQLSGKIPNFNLPLLESLFLNTNKLTDTIPNFSLPNLKYLSLNENQLTGKVPDLMNAPNLITIAIYDNQLDSCPNISYLSRLTDMNLSINKLTFDDIIPNNRFYLTANKYQPQDSFFIDTTFTNLAGTPLSINLNIDGALTTNVYKWYKNGILLDSITRNTRIFNNLRLSDTGVYTCQVTNTLATGLTLKSRKITIKPTCPSILNQNITTTVCSTYKSPSGKMWATSGVFRDTLKSRWGCDSTYYTINLTVTAPPTRQNLTPSVCGAFKTPSGTLLRNSGVYADTLKTQVGCDSLYSSITFSNLRHRDSLALLQVFQTNNGSNWLRKDNWLTATPLNQWYGVRTNAAGCVVALDLDGLDDGKGGLNGGNNLTGALTDSIGNIRSLQSLFLNNNKISKIPTRISNLDSLKNAEFAYCPISNPAQLSVITNLETLVLKGTPLDSSILNTLLGLRKLKQLNLAACGLTGVPAQIANLDSLFSINLDSNRLTSFPNIARLPIGTPQGVLKLGHNQLTFKDLLPNMVFLGKAGIFEYLPQDSIICPDHTANVARGTNYTIDLNIDKNVATNTYRWFKDNVIFDLTYFNNLTLYNLKPCKNGTYSCKVVNYSVPNLTLYCPNQVLSIGEPFQSCEPFEVQTFPNPAQNEVNIRIVSAPDDVRLLKIFNILHQEIASIPFDETALLQGLTLNTSNFSNGTYFLSLYTEGGYLALTKRIQIIKK